MKIFPVPYKTAFLAVRPHSGGTGEGALRLLPQQLLRQAYPVCRCPEKNGPGGKGGPRDGKGLYFLQEGV